MGEPSLAQAGVKGKYSNLMQKLHVPDDFHLYTEFCDWGYNRPVDTYRHLKDLNIPEGYWVYAAPFWYVWQRKEELRDDTIQFASMNGRYEDLLHRIPVPEDLRQFGRVKETGFSQVREYKGFPNLTPGFWVYVFPHWYIWGEQSQPLAGNELKAGVHCKYTRLLKKIPMPQDRNTYGDFFDHGYWDGSSYGPHQNLPTGFWVYVHPHWYIWESLRNTRIYLGV